MPGKIFSIQLCTGHRKPMESVDEADAIANLGLKNDRHAKEGSSRQVLLIDKATLDELRLSPGEVKENITTDGIDLPSLPPSARLSLGKEVVLEITGPCSPCGRMEEIRRGLRAEIAGRRGMLARVIQGGVLRVGDQVELIGMNPG